MPPPPLLPPPVRTKAPNIKPMITTAAMITAIGSKKSANVSVAPKPVRVMLYAVELTVWVSCMLAKTVAIIDVTITATANMITAPGSWASVICPFFLDFISYCM